jgi:hypothetical protein
MAHAKVFEQVGAFERIFIENFHRRFLFGPSWLFSQNRIFDEASVMKSRKFWHAPDTIFYGLSSRIWPADRGLAHTHDHLFEMKGLKALTAIIFVSR